MQEKNGKVENGKEILQQIKKIRSDYYIEQIDHAEEEMSFLDKLNRLVQLILGDDSTSIHRALNKKSLEEWEKKRVSRWFKKALSNYRKIFYFILLATITGFLISEALSFYAIDGIITTKTYIKAILTEVCFIFLSGYRATGTLRIIWANLLRACVFALMMFVISSQTLTIGTKTVSEIDVIQQQVVLIEKQITEKEKLIEYYKEKNWPITTKQFTIKKDELVDKLIILKEKQASGKNVQVSQIEKYKMHGRAFFRVLLLFISVLITRRIFVF